MVVAAPAPAPAAVSLFSNCGVGDIGFAAAGFRFRVMAELLEGRLDIALRNHASASGVAGDLRNTWQDVVARWRLLHGAATPALVAACPPCQGLSTARSDRGPENDPDAGSQDDRNLLVLPISDITRALAPTFVVVENVTAFLRRMVRDPQSGEAISAARLLVGHLGNDYDVYPFLTDLADFGVPQRRKRGVPHLCPADFTHSSRAPPERSSTVSCSVPCARLRRRTHPARGGSSQVRASILGRRERSVGQGFGT